MTGTHDDPFLSDAAPAEDEARRERLRLAAGGALIVTLLAAAMLFGGWLGVVMAG